MKELFYYRNQAGKVAVSCDHGETVIVPTGNVLPPTDAWEDTMEDLRSELTPIQEIKLTNLLKAIPEGPMGDIIEKYGRNRREQERLDGISTSEKPIKRIPETALVVVAEFD